LAAGTATHADGWQFRFGEADADGGMDGQCVKMPQAATYPMAELPRIASRIAREAGEIYVQARRKARDSGQE
jgi:hypothetical protein